MAKHPENGCVLAGDVWHYYVDGKEVTEAVYDNLYPVDNGPPSAAVLKKGKGWPMRSEALACHPTQVGEMNERNAKAGVATRYDADGTAVIPDRNDRKKLLKVEGYFDKHGGYGDG